MRADLRNGSRDVSRVRLGSVKSGEPVAGLLLLSGGCADGLKAVARACRDRLSAEPETSVARTAAALVHAREHLPERLVIAASTREDFLAGLDATLAEQPHPAVVRGRAVGRALPVGFIYAGNGSQWAGMGRSAYARNAHFRTKFDELSLHYNSIEGWSLRDEMLSDDLALRLASARIAQPLLFAIQAATTDALRHVGLWPSVVMGHSVGEIAAAYAAGILDDAQALRVIAARSSGQEMVRGLGTMAALGLSEAEARVLIAACGAGDVEIAAVNSPRSVTLSGPRAGIEICAKLAAARGARVKVLDLEYPFHSALVEVARGRLLDDLEGLHASVGTIPLVSSVTGAVIEGSRLDAGYWWRNVREPVRFADAMACVHRIGARVMLEISPRAILRGYMGECLGEAVGHTALVGSLGPDDPETEDPVRLTLARAIVGGAAVDLNQVFGPAPGDVRLPHYPWQNKRLDVPASPEATSMMQPGSLEHRYLGWRERAGLTEWFSHFDVGVFPELADHKVGGLVYVPGAVLAEMAMAAACCWIGDQSAEIYDFDVLAPLVLAVDHLREVRTTIDEVSRSLSIASRRRLTDEPWQVHVEARFAPMIAGVVGCPAGDDLAGQSEELDLASFYDDVRVLGLDYGPGFQRLGGVCRHADGGVSVAIMPRAEQRYGSLLDPIALDVAFHGLLRTLIAALQPDEHRAYVPIRFGRVRLLQPGVAVASARISGVRYGITTVLCDVILLDAAGAVVAEVRAARFKSGTFVRRRSLKEIAYHLRSEGRPLPPALSTFWPAHRAPMPTALVAVATAPRTERADEARLLLEAAARRVAIDVTASLAVEGVVSPSVLLAHGRISPRMLTPLAGLLNSLEGAGLVNADGASWRVSQAAQVLPPLDVVVQTVMAEHPEWWPDCALVAEAAAAWGRLLADPASEPPLRPYPPALDEAFTAASPRSRGRIERVLSALALVLSERSGTDDLAGQSLRVLEIGCGQGALTRPLAVLLSRHGGRLVAADSQPSAIERLRAMLDTDVASVVEASALEAMIENWGPFDLVVSADGRCGAGTNATGLMAAAKHCLPQARLIAVHAAPSTFHDVVFGCGAGWFDGAPAKLKPVGPLSTLAGWRRALGAAGVADIVGAEADGDVVLAGTMTADAAVQDASGNHACVPGNAVVMGAIGAGGQPLAVALTAALKAEGCTVEIVRGPVREPQGTCSGTADVWRGALAASLADPTSKPEIVIVSGDAEVSEHVDPAATLSRCLVDLAGLLQALGERQFRLWIVAPGGLRGLTPQGRVCAVQEGIVAFGRAAANEHGGGDIRIVDIEEEMSAKDVARHIAAMLRSPGQETEVIIGPRQLTVVRAAGGLSFEAFHERLQPPPDLGTRLELARHASGERMAWRHVSRRAPGSGEVEIAVTATGLNFRDVMWSMSLLPEEALQDGFAGPTLGFECSGTVTRAGQGVTGLKAGDLVLAFAPAAFASHVTVAASAVAAVPPGLDPVAAATIPVSFITAHFALVELAQLGAGESVLIHGGAGGVGLAALQIAKARGATVIATAGTSAKRNLLALLGADHVLDSRTLAFADGVRALTAGAGVDVVLNSLAGEAMEASLALVKPFGRFLELGKRDFYGSTKIGLRPFRRNVSYFGIDADQLLSQKPALARKVLAAVMEEVAAGTYVALPYRRYDAEDAGDAFRLMQQSGHIGKIVVTPPAGDALSVDMRDSTFSADPAGAHVIVGGTGGFGLSTARWLIERGARRLVLISRSGQPSAGDRHLLEKLQASGARIDVVAVDATDRGALAKELSHIRRHSSIRGIVHAAMVIDDELIASLTPEGIDRVLAPKVAAASHLDRLTRDDPLQYFVLYSSVTTLIGNPGQAAYVAANGFLEGLARQRRAAGLPALAVGWGGITDTGYLVRNADVGRSIERRTGTASFTAAEALDALGELLAMGPSAPAVVTVAPMSWEPARQQLPLLAKPLFGPLMAREAASVAAPGAAIDVVAQISVLDEAGARELVCRHLSDEIARIFRMPVADVNPSRSLAELGMDSLMGLELRLAVQQRLGADIPLSAMAGNQTLAEVAGRIAGTLRRGNGAVVTGGEARVGVADADLARQHVSSDLDAVKLAPLLREIERRDQISGG